MQGDATVGHEFFFPIYFTFVKLKKKFSSTNHHKKKEKKLWIRNNKTQHVKMFYGELYNFYSDPDLTKPNKYSKSEILKTF